MVLSCQYSQCLADFFCVSSFSVVLEGGGDFLYWTWQVKRKGGGMTVRGPKYSTDYLWEQLKGCKWFKNGLHQLLHGFDVDTTGKSGAFLCNLKCVRNHCQKKHHYQKEKNHYQKITTKVERVTQKNPLYCLHFPLNPLNLLMFRRWYGITSNIWSQLLQRSLTASLAQPAGDEVFQCLTVSLRNA